MLISNGWMSYERPTPQSTIEAIMYCVRERGLAALKEPTNRVRLDEYCDARAKAQINSRIEKLRVAGRLPEKSRTREAANA